jgi:hypothetical protein
MERQPERLPDRQGPNRPPTRDDLARLAASRRALDGQSDGPGPEGPGGGAGGQAGPGTQGGPGSQGGGGPRGRGAQGPGQNQGQNQGQGPQGPGFGPRAAQQPGPGFGPQAAHDQGFGPQAAQNQGHGPQGPQGPNTGEQPRTYGPTGGGQNAQGQNAQGRNRRVPPQGDDPRRGAPGPQQGDPQQGGPAVPVIPPPGPRNPAGELVTVHNLPMPKPTSTPMRAERPPAPRPMSDLTTTMPIIIPPDEHGRHRTGARIPRAVKVGGIFAVAVGMGIAVASGLGGSHHNPATDLRAGTTAPNPVAQTTADGDAAADPNATPPASADSTPTSKATKPHGTATHPASPTTSPSGSASSAAQPPVTPSTSAKPTTSPSFQTLEQGDNGPAVIQLQQALINACYMTVYPGYQLGYFDYTTYRAVSRFQNRFGGSSDGTGIYGPATAAALKQNPHGRC